MYKITLRYSKSRTRYLRVNSWWNVTSELKKLNVEPSEVTITIADDSNFGSAGRKSVIATRGRNAK